MTSRWNSSVAPHTANPAMTASMIAATSAINGLSTSTPAIWPKKTARNGTTTQAENCCAVRGSFTRDEIATIAAIAISAKSGVQTRNTVSQPGLTIALKTRTLVAAARTPAIKIDPASHVSTIDGINEASILAVSSSQVLIGVDSIGSEVLLVFSPTMLYAAIMLGSIMGISKNMLENA